MGRTTPTYRDVVEKKKREWRDYRNSLRYRERVAFDRLFEMARETSHAGTNQASFNPMDSIYLSILLKMELRIMELERELDEAVGDEDDVV
ncbi:hypothetical protein [Methanonatronarchaeum sp. AMET6-2]|uniref:hypothetical protein n=1 Tax=Methanonatronarchaeum sp. AMET6-2 TaxID=2933293 RepID=UPI001224765E|nr:hypothetical protein [Methanonatronarchaeum sp. AMET6-2]RZN62224.1 MAG: hypothetical protein EF811_03195 [Methanonatronarchaeia archaeon]UOY10441.1 hypothetical protein MU439_02070 [Methanonatronarchaeum sp. AMET6-2]